MKLKRRTFLGSLLALTAVDKPKAKIAWEATCVIDVRSAYPTEINFTANFIGTKLNG